MKELLELFISLFTFSPVTELGLNYNDEIDYNLLIGYVTPRQFGPFSMPVPAQNSCLREYASSNGFSYGLTQCEHIFEGSYVQFFGTLNTVENGMYNYVFSTYATSEGKDLEYTENLITKEKIKNSFCFRKKYF